MFSGAIAPFSCLLVPMVPMHSISPTSSLNMPCLVSNFTGIPVMIMNIVR